MLQVYFILYSLRGGIILGVFPSFLGVVKVLSSRFYKKDPDEPIYEFKKTYKEVFKTSNIVGFIMVGLVWLLIFDYNFNKQVLDNKLLSISLVILLVLILIILSHLPIVVLRMELKIKDYFIQSLILALSSIFNTISVILSLVLLELILIRLPILFLLLGIPILAMPFAWFSYNSLDKILEKTKEN